MRLLKKVRPYQMGYGIRASIDFADTSRTNGLNQPGRSQDVIYYDAVVNE